MTLARAGGACDDVVMTVTMDPPLVGRLKEQRQLQALLAAVESSRSAVLVIRGDAGMGKTALLTQLASTATEFRVLNVCGSELEMEMPYAGVQQLCGPLLPFLDRLPEAQRAGLETALGLRAGHAPDRLIVCLAILGLLGAAGEDRPTLCIVDDAQWLDTVSLQTVAFVARRLLAEPVAMVFATRTVEPHRALRGHPELVLGGLDGEQARALLSSALPAPLDVNVMDTLIAEAKGNPLALLELHRALTPAELAGGYGLAGAADPHVLERSFCRRLRRLPYDTAMLLLVAAAETAGRPEWVWAAAKHLSIDIDDARHAEAEGLIVVQDGALRFRHPLIRATIYRGAPVHDRRTAHNALAAVITGTSAEDFRAWHRAHGSSGIGDDAVADELENSARRARGRGGAAAAAAFLAKAAALSNQPAQRAHRALHAAEAKLDAGLPRAAAPLLAMAESNSDDEQVIARAELIRARAAFAADRGADAPRLLLSAASRLAGVNAALSRETHLQAITAAIVVGRCATDTHTTPSMVAQAAAKAPQTEGDPRAVDLLLDGLILRLTEGHKSAASTLIRAIHAYKNEVAQGTADPRWHDITHRVCLDVFDIDSYNFLAQRQVEQLRKDGALAVLPLALQTCSGIEVSSGNLSKAALLLAESELITDVTGASLPGCLWAYLAAYRGDEQHCLDVVQRTITRAKERGDGYDIDGALYSAAILHLGLGQYAQAFAAASAARPHDDLGVHSHVLNELVEAAVRCGDLPAATSAAAELRAQADACPTSTALGMAARAEALTTEGNSAESAYRAAIDHLQSSPFAVYLPRAHLVYGEWLRRQKRRADARVHLKTAHEMFVQMRLSGFALRALREVRTTGEPVINRDRKTATGLTAQEARIATLVSEGYTNVEIGAQLFVSPRTVEWHLNHIFSKLAVTSRRQLRNMQFTVT